MGELVSIVIAVVALLLGLAGIGWAYGDFRQRQDASTAQDQNATSPASR